MGVGKSTLGKKLSEKLKLEFYDTDKEVEKKTGKSINDIFIDYGEDYFREMEENIIINLLNRKESLVISFGGGAYLNANIRKNMCKKTISIWLDADIKSILTRLSRSNNIRPLMNKLSSNSDIEKLLKKRNKVYKKADIRIDISSLGRARILKITKESLKKYLVNNYENSGHRT
tara:strand:- start:634 stop:1155 length:522 start_codon:yes stop_codon:yes gene_type:complete